MASKLKNQLHTYPPGASETGCAYPYCPDPIANNIVLDDLNAVIAQTNLSNEIQQLLAVGLPAQSALAPEYYHIVCDQEYVDPTQLSGIVADFCLCYQDPELAASQHIDCEILSDVYWYHPDYLGSNELITDITGEPYQYFLYTPFGETILQEDAFNASYDNPFRFNGKEIDLETGNYYYGARYYNPRWSVWLSVDPLAHKYPSMSPFVFTGNNPIILVDPDGKKFVLAGKMWQSAYNQLKSGLASYGVDLTIDENTGELCYTLNMNNKVTSAVQAFLDVIDDDSYSIKMIATSNKKTSNGALYHGGAFMGSDYNKDSNGNETVDGTQEVNPDFLGKVDAANGTSGTMMLHEATEASIAAMLSMASKTDAIPNGSTYIKAHQQASPQHNNIFLDAYDSNGNLVLYTDPSAVRWEWIVEDKNNKQTLIQSYP